MQVTATTDGGFGRTLTVDYNFGANLEEMVELFGADIAFLNARRNMVITLQGLIRSSLKKEKDTLEETREKADKWSPKEIAERKTKAEKAADLTATMSDAEKADLIAALQATIKK